ncbi:MAG: dephospho-CoA kinase, partial [Thermomicrobiales bacterium]
MSHPYVIGVTGGIATGKSTILAMLGDRGAVLIDADAVYHELIAPGLQLWQDLHDRFGDGIVGPEGNIDRKALGAIVFSDTSALEDLERLTHPAVVREIERRIVATTSAVVAVDAVKLSESGLGQACDQIWLVTCDEEVQRARLMARNHLSPEEAKLRLAAQPDREQHAKIADVIIDNSGALEETT